MVADCAVVKGWWGSGGSEGEFGWGWGGGGCGR